MLDHGESPLGSEYWITFNVSEDDNFHIVDNRDKENSSKYSYRSGNAHSEWKYPFLETFPMTIIANEPELPRPRKASALRKSPRLPKIRSVFEIIDENYLIKFSNHFSSLVAIDRRKSFQPEWPSQDELVNLSLQHSDMFESEIKHKEHTVASLNRQDADDLQ